MNKERTGQSRSVTFVYGGIAGALLLVVAAVALVVVPPSPPAIAEFTPSPDDVIDEAPSDQSSQFGAGGAGACASAEAGCVVDPETGALVTTTTTPAGASTVVEKARVRRCVGDPPRQTEDPQSPPCVNYWQGDNGGATSRGVTRDEIRIGIRPGLSSQAPTRAAIIEFFNRRFELYGRKLRAVTVSSPCDAVGQRAAAAKAEELGIFAMVGSPCAPLDMRPFVAELARRGVVSIDDTPAFQTQANLTALRPYAWTYGPTLDVSLANTAEWACRQLVGRAPRYGAEPSLAAQRSFAILRRADDNGGTPPDVSILDDGLRGCGAPVRVVELPRHGADPLENYGAYRATLAQLRSEGRTTLICVCRSNELYLAQNAADENQYRPEWINPAMVELSSDMGSQGNGSTQDAFVFGLGAANKPQPVESHPAGQAIREVDPSLSFGFSGNDFDSVVSLYHALLVFASGVQGAGPTLTPQSFEKGLMSTKFPNPGAGAAPFWQAHVGFGPDDRSMTDDFAVIYRDPNANSDKVQTYARAGWCYLDRGTRWRRGSWPSTEQQLFDRTKPCR